MHLCTEVKQCSVFCTIVFVLFEGTQYLITRWQQITSWPWLTSGARMHSGTTGDGLVISQLVAIPRSASQHLGSTQSCSQIHMYLDKLNICNISWMNWTGSIHWTDQKINRLYKCNKLNEVNIFDISWRLRSIAIQSILDALHKSNQFSPILITSIW